MTRLQTIEAAWSVYHGIVLSGPVGDETSLAYDRRRSVAYRALIQAFELASD